MSDFNKETCLVAYFSRAGDNYVSGKIVNLPVGNTEVAAKIIEKLTGGSLFKIESVGAYPKDYNQTTEVAQEEQRSHARPELATHVENMAVYQVIFLGYPNWWGTMPMPVFTFLEEYDFSNKVIVPFCTHEGSGLGHSERDIAKVCPNAKVSKGLAIRGTDVHAAESQITNWLNSIRALL